MTRGTWLEVALNGPWSRTKQPRMPITRDEIVEAALACVGEGAAIVHLHAYDERTCRQRDDYELYAPIIERIRARCDAVVYPTLPFAGSADAAGAWSPARRFAAVERLLRAGLIEWSVVDPGSLNIATIDDVAAGREGFVYANPESHIRYGLELARHYRMTPSYAIYEPGFLRLGAALHAAYAGAPRPVYRYMFSEQFLFGCPPQAWALDAYLKLLDACARGAAWMVAGLGVDIEPLIEAAVERGGHVRVGLEDAPLGADTDNRTLVQRAARRIGAAGGRLATPAEVRAAAA
jgi:3-keto-5-aminohexanoate cleavage enzyme